MTLISVISGDPNGGGRSHVAHGGHGTHGGHGGNGGHGHDALENMEQELGEAEEFGKLIKELGIKVINTWDHGLND